MEWIVSGVVLWCLFHFVPAFGPGLKTQLVQRVGPKPYRGFIALGIFSGLGMMYWGWTNTDPIDIYDPPDWALHANNTLMLISIYLLVSSDMKTRVRAWVRHPMLLGFAIWGVAHLIANGDQRSVVVFGALSLWAIVEIVLINRRDGDWESPRDFNLKTDIFAIISSVVVLAIIVWIHTLFDLVPYPMG